MRQYSFTDLSCLSTASLRGMRCECDITLLSTPSYRYNYSLFAMFFCVISVEWTERGWGAERERAERKGGGGGEGRREKGRRERERERLSHVAPLLLFVVPRTNLWLCLNSWLLSEGVTVWPTAFFFFFLAILKFIYSSFVPMLYFGSNSYWTYLSKKLTCPH